MLRFSRYRFSFTALDPIRLPAFAGSALRGLLGHGLLRTVCVTNLEDCKDCPLRRHCAYTYLFETQIAIAPQGPALQPMVLTLDDYRNPFVPGESFSFQLTLVGRANRHLPYLIPAWQRAGRRGLGQQNASFNLDAVELLDIGAGHWQQLYPQPELGLGFAPTPTPWRPPLQAAPERVQIDLLTPYRGRLAGHLVTPASFEPQGFLISLAKRIESLRAQHDPESPPLPLGDWVRAAAQLQLTGADLHWTEVVRHSSRQRTDMNLGGVTGRFQLSGSGLRQLHPLLALGQWLHAGKNSLFGLGHYRLTDLGEGHD